MKHLLAMLSAMLLVLAGYSAPAWAEDEEESQEESEESSEGGCSEPDGARDHPAIPRFPDSCIDEFQQREFEGYEFPLSSGEEGKTKTVEGRYFMAGYSMKPGVSCTQVMRNYENAFKAANLKINKGKKLPEASESGSAGFSVSWYCDRWMTGVGKAKSGAEFYVLETCVEHGDETFALTLVVEPKNMEQVIEVASADFMAEEIARTGRIALYGITFATGKSEITPASAKELEEIGKLLAQKPDWKLRIEGHTDNVGNVKANLDLSKKRAAAVKAWLTKNKSIKAAQLTTEGYGDAKPVSDNTSDEGRAKNRRVELVKL